MMPTQRVRLRIRGVVQGVGFRPLVYRIARELELVGFVRNDGGGVTVELQGPASQLNGFETLLRQRLPTQGRIDEVSRESLELLASHEFLIESSQSGGQGASIPPDLASCSDCLAELLDPGDRRYLYPLLNCTVCGPRYTVITALPYDRSNTTLWDFPLCPDCLREYRDPQDRRFHAQPTACRVCGPQLWTRPPSDDPLMTALTALRQGQIVAVKGLGGYHLACRADLPEAVVELRRRKNRPHQPLALMVKDARPWVELDAEQEELLRSPARPIVVEKQVGVMLPYTPVHELLCEFPLLMTSANLSGEPICIDDETDLSSLCSLVLGHTRPIAVACEDSVIVGKSLVRRSRGYAPAPIAVDVELPPLLAVGGELKSTLAVACRKQVWLSGHIGDSASYATLQRLAQTAHHLEGMLGITPQMLVADCHPDYQSRRWADREAVRRGVPLVLVQHHHAHVASLLAEHQHSEEVLAFVFDGTGWGPDGSIWGGEVLLADYAGFQRLAWLDPTPMPGGEASIRSPYRLALSYLQRAQLAWEGLPCTAAASPQERLNVGRLPGPLTSSMGRLFDVVSSLLGVCQRVTYEGQAACELEAICEEDSGTLTFDLEGTRILWERALGELVASRDSPGRLAMRFHRGLADLVLRLALRWGQGRKIALSGGCFCNQTLLQLVQERLDGAGLEMLVHRQVPANDGGLALGQALVAAHRGRRS